MKSFKYFLGSMSVMFMLSSCSDDDGVINNCAERFWAAEVADEAAVLSSASINFSNAPTVETCNAFRVAAQDYLDALEDARSCVDNSDRAEFDEAVDEAQESVNELDCNIDFEG
ncbi:MAG: hypothetical protein AAF039_08975 [Bacteroidota bacterium]